MVFVASLIFLSYFALLNSGHPLIMALILVLASGLVAIYAGMSVSKWIMCSIFLIFLGGMMVMFLYVCTLSMNEKFLPSSGPAMLGSVMLVILLMSSQGYNEVAQFFTLSAFYSFPWNMSICFMILYLISVLLLCVKCVQSFKGALTKAW